MTKKRIEVSRHHYFEYYSTGTTDLSESLNPGCAFELDSVRLHCSTGFVSVVDLIVQISSVLGSAYDYKFQSVAMSGLLDYMYGFGGAILNNGDTLNITLSYDTSNVYGLIINGWAISE